MQPSSTTTISKWGYVCLKTLLMVAAIYFSALYTGMTMDTRGFSLSNFFDLVRNFSGQHPLHDFVNEAFYTPFGLGVVEIHDWKSFQGQQEVVKDHKQIE